jgi:hypothetical protein
MLAFRIFEDAGFHKKLRAVPEDDEGIDMGYLRDQIRKSEDKAKSENNNEPVSAVADLDESVAFFVSTAMLHPSYGLRARTRWK